jgi:putative endonuclease
MKCLGDWAEEKAVHLLKKRGYKILEKNFKSPFGEVDIIASKNNYIIFVEVKGRSSDLMGSAQEAVDKRKQRKITLSALYYMKKRGIEDKQVRFDTVCINEGEAEIIEDAFFAQ